MKQNITIDFFELAFLAEACIPPQPIARTSFWYKLIDVIYYYLEDEERESIYTWMQREYRYKKGIEEGNNDCLWFKYRFDKEFQYEVVTEFEGVETTHQAFLVDDRYYITHRTNLGAEFIKETKKI